METWAQIQNGFATDYVNENPEGKHHPSIKFVKVPDLYILLDYRNLAFEDNKLVPINISDFDNFLFEKIKIRRHAEINDGLVSYKEHDFSTNKDNFDTLTSKYTTGKIQDESKKSSYNVSIKTKTGYLDMTTKDLATVIALIDGYTNNAFKREKDCVNAIVKANEVQEKVEKAELTM